MKKNNRETNYHPIHVLHVIDALAPGGAERMAIEIANACDKQRFRVSICVTRSSQMELSRFLDPDIALFCLERNRQWDLNKFHEFIKFCDFEKVDIFHAHGRSSFLFLALMHLFSTNMWHRGIVLHDHYGDIEIDRYLSLSLLVALNWLSPFYVGVHEDLTKLAQDFNRKPDRFVTIQNAISFRPFQDIVRAKQASKIGKELIGVVISNVRPSKDILMLLDALSDVKHLSWKVDIVGGWSDDDYTTKCKKRAVELGIDNRVSFLGTRLDIVEILARADFALLASKTESGPLALIEYAAAGLPFVSTRVGLVGKQMANRGVKEFVEPGNAQQFAYALARLLVSVYNEREQQGLYGKQIAREMFDIKVVLPRWYDVYNKALRLRQ